MDGKKFLQDACSKYNLDFDSLFCFGIGRKKLAEYHSEYGYKKSTIVQNCSNHSGVPPKFAIKFMEKDQIYIAWPWLGAMIYNIFVKDIQVQEGEIRKVSHYRSVIGGKQDEILIFKPDVIDQFIGHYIIGGK